MMGFLSLPSCSSRAGLSLRFMKSVFLYSYLSTRARANFLRGSIPQRNRDAWRQRSAALATRDRDGWPFRSVLDPAGGPQSPDRSLRARRKSPPGAPAREEEFGAPSQEDRKSTRLNSSHMSISY